MKSQFLVINGAASNRPGKITFYINKGPRLGAEPSRSGRDGLAARAHLARGVSISFATFILSRDSVP